MKINCIIVDDEPLARKGLAEYVAEIDFLELTALCESPMAANQILSTKKVDLMFLDIQMPKMTGLELLKTLREPPLVIFTTAYAEYALQGYELDVLDYLVKPISFERFLKAVNKAREFCALKAGSNAGNGRPAEYFFIKCDNRYEKINYDELLFAEALENYVVLHTASKKFTSYLTLKGVEDYLPDDRFIKVHKSYIISLSKIDNVAGHEIKIGKFTIPVSRTLKDEIMNNVVNSKLLKR